MAFRYGRYGDCRMMGHAWEAVPGDWTPTLGGVPMTLRCLRCSMERRDTVGTNTGEVVSRRYVEPEGYYWHPDSDQDERPTRTEYRLAWVTDHIVKAQRSRPKGRAGRDLKAVS